MKNTMKWLFPFIVLAVLAPWPVAYAFDASDGMIGQDAVRIEAADPSAAPDWQVSGGAIGGVTPGDLFYIDATDNTTDIQVILYITNTSELIHNYSYLMLKVGIYVETGEDEWKQTAQWNGEPTPDTFITLRNGQVSFTLSGYANYKVTIDSGNFNCITTNADGGSLSPQFFLEVD